LRVLIVGGGIAGQTLACALARRSIACEIVELRPDFQIAGAAMTLQGTALRTLQDFGLVEETIAAGWQGGERPVVFTDSRGQPVLEPELVNMVGDAYPPQIAIRRQALHDVLQRGVRRAGVPVRMGTTVTALADLGDEVEATFSDGTHGRYGLVVGADGIRSVVRSLVFGECQPQFAGFANWRAILPCAPSVKRMVWMWGRGKSVGVLPVDDGLMYVAGVTREKDTTRYPQADLLRLFRERFASFGGVMPDVLALAGEAPWLYTVMEEVKLDPPWHRGRVVLVGDASHAACPFWAQGAAMAMEDAVALAESLQSRAPVTQALSAWMARRYERCRYVQEGSLDTGRATHRDDESDEPSFFPPSVRPLIAEQFHQRELKMAEPF
jgi:2-polyprenyl-6-methoxyphenol hydroxylase-like FAD-dependent oxidoreductase